LFVYTVFVAKVGHFSGWAGSIVLMIIAIPIIIRTTDNVFTLVPKELKEAAIALGTPQWKVILRIILPIAKPGIVTGAILSIARISGETAPLLFTSLNNQFWSLNMNKPLTSLPVVIFQYAMSPYKDWQNLAWSGALFLTLFVFFLNISVRLLFRQKIVLG
jgi:phosphate transport system permease protein